MHTSENVGGGLRCAPPNPGLRHGVLHLGGRHYRPIYSGRRWRRVGVLSPPLLRLWLQTMCVSVSVSVSVSVFVCVYVCVYTHTYVCIYTYIHQPSQLALYISTCTIYIYIYIYIYMYIYILYI